MKPQLIKFPCPACGARLAVPEAMAGMEDHCPKCSSVVRAPMPEPAAAEPRKRRVADRATDTPPPPPTTKVATAPAKTRKPSPAPPIYQTSLFDEFLSAPIAQPKAAEPPPPAETPDAQSTPVRLTELLARQPALHEITPPSHLSAAAPPATVPPAIEEPQVERQPASESPQAPAPPADEIPAPEPSSEPTAPEAHEDHPPEFGMGVMLAGESAPAASAETRQLAAPLGVGLMQLGEPPQHLRRRRVAVIGIMVFLAVDALLLLWFFRHRIEEWWDPRPAAPVAAAGSGIEGDPSGTAQTPPADDRTTVAPQPAPGESPPPPSAQSSLPQLPSVTTPVATPVPYAPDGAVTPTPAIPLSPPPDSKPMAGPGSAPATPAESAAAAKQADTTPATNPPKATLVLPPPIEPRKDLGIPALAAPPSLDTPAPLVVPPALSAPPTLNLPEAPGTPGTMSRTEVPPPPPPPPLPGVEPAATVPPPPADTADTPVEAKDGGAPPDKVSEIGVTNAARPALTALKSFLAAPTWQERLGWCQKPDTVKSIMARHHRSHPDGPVAVSRIELIERYPAKKGATAYCMFEVSGKGLKRPVLVLVEESSKGARVDWEAFVEFKEQLLWEFLIKPGSAPQKFRVMVRRKHYFDKDVPDMDKKDPLQLTQPGADAEANVFVTRSSSAGRALTQQLGWGDSLAAIVELAWRSDGTHRWVEVQSVPAFGWRG